MNKRTAAALGLFDGIHLGHRDVIKYALNFEKNGLLPAVFTFKNSTVLEKQGRKLEYIYNDFQKELILKNLGIKKIFSEDFNLLKKLSGEEFVEQILLDKINADCVICGQDFKFGINASCGIQELMKFGRKYNFKVVIVPDVQNNGINISSNRIRKLIKDGGISEANSLLGEVYHIQEEVTYGRQLGRTLDFPTINQNFEENQLVPKFGVYRSETLIEDKFYKSITNIGIKPTVQDNQDKNKPVAETHILDYSGNLYNKKIKVNIYEFLRPEIKFLSIEELKKQISSDVEYVKNKIS